MTGTVAHISNNVSCLSRAARIFYDAPRQYGVGGMMAGPFDVGHGDPPSAGQGYGGHDVRVAQRLGVTLTLHMGCVIGDAGRDISGQDEAHVNRSVGLLRADGCSWNKAACADDEGRHEGAPVFRCDCGGRRKSVESSVGRGDVAIDLDGACAVRCNFSHRSPIHKRRLRPALRSRRDN
ncbi:hypothetical protein BQ8482_111516 [Mesorhizobium delmotii]|uniref:Uncharacterized protein n=1 Tax=Mesorhizobium delmotii TaxID=1631247 RepID=A0A2P9AEP9_9HYPH|nr:hypothetical protein BQ8482_111516 [Mesorhizobium delmotii]